MIGDRENVVVVVVLLQTLMWPEKATGDCTKVVTIQFPRICIRELQLKRV
jgi:hypothetical protein